MQSSLVGPVQQSLCIRLSKINTAVLVTNKIPCYRKVLIPTNQRKSRHVLTLAVVQLVNVSRSKEYLLSYFQEQNCEYL